MNNNDKIKKAKESPIWQNVLKTLNIKEDQLIVDPEFTSLDGDEAGDIADLMSGREQVTIKAIKAKNLDSMMMALGWGDDFWGWYDELGQYLCDHYVQSDSGDTTIYQVVG